MVKQVTAKVALNIDRDVIPGLNEELVEHLEAIFPPRCQNITENGNAHQRYAGKVELVELLREHLTRRNQEHLDAVTEQ
jgi:hypothetical protein